MDIGILIMIVGVGSFFLTGALETAAGCVHNNIMRKARRSVIMDMVRRGK